MRAQPTTWEIRKSLSQTWTPQIYFCLSLSTVWWMFVGSGQWAVVGGDRLVEHTQYLRRLQPVGGESHPEKTQETSTSLGEEGQRSRIFHQQFIVDWFESSHPRWELHKFVKTWKLSGTKAAVKISFSGKSCLVKHSLFCPLFSSLRSSLSHSCYPRYVSKYVTVFLIGWFHRFLSVSFASIG